MSRTLFGSMDFTTENIKDDDDDGVSLTQLADEIFTSEVLSAYQETDVEADETVELVAKTATESLEAISAALVNKEDITALTYESYVGTISTASKLLSAGLTIASIDSTEWDEKKEEVLTDLETTVEGFLSNIKSSIGNVSRKIANGTKNLMTVVFTRQKALGKMAAKLEKKMAKRSAGDVAGTTVRVGSASNWFEDGSDANEKLATFAGLRAAMPGVQDGLKALPDALADTELDADKMHKILTGGIKDLAKAPGVKVETKNTDKGEIEGILIPSTKGHSKLLAVGKAVGKAAAGAGGVYGATYLMAGAAMFASVPTTAILAGSIVLAFGTYKALTWAFKKRLPTMEWGEISGVLNNVQKMAETKLSLSGVTKALSALDKVAKKAAEGSEDKKSATKGLIRLIGSYGAIFRSIYSSSVACARAAVGYATSSLKLHIKGAATEEKVLEEDTFYQDVSTVCETFERLDVVLSGEQLSSDNDEDDNDEDDTDEAGNESGDE